MLCLPEIANADFLQGSALTTGINVTLTVGPDTFTILNSGQAEANGVIQGGQSYNTSPTGIFSHKSLPARYKSPMHLAIHLPKALLACLAR